MGILKGNGAHPPLYFYMYRMFFFPRKLFISFVIIIIDSAIPSNLYLKSMCTTSEFCKSTSMSSVVHKDNIILRSMIWLIFLYHIPQ